jgi:hypothetical protein
MRCTFACKLVALAAAAVIPECTTEPGADGLIFVHQLCVQELFVVRHLARGSLAHELDAQLMFFLLC